MECMTSIPIGEWIESAIGADSTNEIARRSDLTVSTVHRQRTSGNYSPETVAKIARAYGVSVIDGLVVHGVLTPADVDSSRALDALADATDQQLLDEIASRLERVPEGESEVFDNLPERDAEIHYPHFTAVEDERAVASERSDDDGEDTNYED